MTTATGHEPLEWSTENVVIGLPAEYGGNRTILKHRSTSRHGTFEVTDMQDREPCRIRHYPPTSFGLDFDARDKEWVNQRMGPAAQRDPRLDAAVQGQEIGYALDFELAKVGIDALLAAGPINAEVAVEAAGFDFRHVVGTTWGGDISIHVADIEAAAPDAINYMQLEVSDIDVHLAAAGDDEADNGQTNVFRLGLTDTRGGNEPTFWAAPGANRKDAMLSATLAVATAFRMRLAADPVPEATAPSP